MNRRAKGEGTLYFDRGRGKWIGQADAGINPRTGQRRRIKVIARVGESKADVARRLAERIGELDGSLVGPTTVADLLDLWLTRAAPKRKSEKSLLTDRRLVEIHILPRFGQVKVAALTVEDVEEWLESLLEDLARTTVAKIRGQMAMAFDFGIRRRHVSWNPARIAELPPSNRRPRESRALTGPEARALLNVSYHHRLGAWITVALNTGLRPGEVSGLTWESLALDDGLMVIHQAMTWVKETPTLKQSTKTGRARTLDIPSSALEALRRHRNGQVEERLLMGDRWPLRWGDLAFITTSGTPISPSNMRRTVATLAEEAGIDGKVTPYTLRHTATSLLSASGVAPELLADLLGHVDTRMVFRHYRHPVTPTISVAADHIEAALSR